MKILISLIRFLNLILIILLMILLKKKREKHKVFVEMYIMSHQLNYQKIIKNNLGFMFKIKFIMIIK